MYIFHSRFPGLVVSPFYAYSVMYRDMAANLKPPTCGVQRPALVGAQVHQFQYTPSRHHAVCEFIIPGPEENSQSQARFLSSPHPLFDIPTTLPLSQVNRRGTEVSSHFTSPTQQAPSQPPPSASPQHQQAATSHPAKAS
jgi:hypothetical protein